MTAADRIVSRIMATLPASLDERLAVMNDLDAMFRGARVSPALRDEVEECRVSLVNHLNSQREFLAGEWAVGKAKE